MNRNPLACLLLPLLCGLFFISGPCVGDLRAEQAELLEFTGPTMGTKFMVKVYDPPKFQDDIRFQVDALLRQVNDQMSTYLKNSEVSRFNRSDSTEWFDVSTETAMVVDFARQVSEKTDGAFDVTVGPLVNAWSFGPDPRTRTVPDADKLESLRRTIGYQKLHVRLDPPALRKTDPALKIDLSAIAKGHGVDRVVELLNDEGAANVFVEIGGEVRTSGSKGGTWWKVGIQMPDARRDSVLIAHSMNVGAGNDQAMATSGDYRNFFEAEGVRYSHTIDPRTGRPIEHALASVTVIAESCMAADAWATALNVLGSEQGLEVAKRESLEVLLIARDEDVESGYRLSGTGTLAPYSTDTPRIPDANAKSRADGKDAAAAGAVPEEAGPRVGNSPLVLFVITTVAFAVLLFAMSVGVLFGRRAISGSCGGLSSSPNEDGSVSCSLCSNPSDACSELRERMKREVT